MEYSTSAEGAEKPIIKQIQDSRAALDFFETASLPAEDEKTQEIDY
ncbi:hypothetical protein SAMN02910358_02262 [Lachnospiraceae bacterium XBB1006]|nr:hypothetical protein SAMN02910358_02262 [Lachnospiraceae bacterium XBB1006]